MNITKLRAALIGGAAALAASYAVAQVTLPLVASLNAGDYMRVVPNGFPSAGNVFATMTQVRTTSLAQAGGHTGTPTLTTSGSGCGSSTGSAISGTDVSGVITEGSTNSTSCVMTFAKAYTSAPECFVSINGVADTALKCATTASNATITSTSANSQSFDYLVVGQPGG